MTYPPASGGLACLLVVIASAWSGGCAAPQHHPRLSQEPQYRQDLAAYLSLQDKRVDVDLHQASVREALDAFGKLAGMPARIWAPYEGWDLDTEFEGRTVTIQLQNVQLSTALRALCVELGGDFGISYVWEVVDGKLTVGSPSDLDDLWFAVAYQVDDALTSRRESSEAAQASELVRLSLGHPNAHTSPTHSEAYRGGWVILLTSRAGHRAFESFLEDMKVIKAADRSRIGTYTIERLVRGRMDTTKLTVDWSDIPLHRALRQIADEAQVPIWVDWKGLGHCEMWPESKFTLKLEGAPAGEVLAKLLHREDPRRYSQFSEQIVAKYESGYVMVAPQDRGRFRQQVLTARMMARPQDLILPEGFKTIEAYFDSLTR